MWAIIGAVAVLLAAVLFYIAKNSGSSKEAPDFAAGGAISVSSSGGTGNGDSKEEEDDGSRVPITFYFGSQTGTAEGFCKTLASESRRAGFKPSIVDLEDFEADAFVESASSNAMVVFLMSTYGEGEPTDNATEFYEWLKDSNGELAADCLQGMKFTVFGLGNRQYEHYNKMGRVTKKRLAALGAEEVFPSGEGDDDGTLDEDFEEWKESMWGPIAAAVGLGAVDADTTGGPVPLDDLEWTVRYLKSVPSKEEVQAAHRAVLPSSCNMSSRYYFTSVPAKVIVNRELRKGGEGSTRHIEIDIKGTSLTYTEADNLGVCAENATEVVESLARWMDYDLDAWFTLERADSEVGRSAKPMFPTPCTVREALSRYCDFNGHVRKDFLGHLAHFATKDSHKDVLMRLSSKEGKQEFHEFIVDAKRSMFEVLEEFPSCRIPLDRLFQLVPRLAPRLYTICNSPHVSPSRIHAVVSVVQEKKPGPGNRVFHGVCSNYMARCLPPSTAGGRRTDGEESKSEGRRGPWPTMLVHVRPSTFHLPKDPSVPIIMVGPGTGIAPMRAFLQERNYQRSQGMEVGDTVLFFGCRRPSEDYIYQEELEMYRANGTLTEMPIAFSREDPSKKVYVQHRLEEHKELVWNLIHEQRGHFYVCGYVQDTCGDYEPTLTPFVQRVVSGTHMGKDVQDVLERIAEEYLAPQTSGHDYVQQMHHDKRYIAELWS